MTKKRVFMGLVLLALSVLPMCSAFPLSGGNGVDNATVFGVSKVEASDVMHSGAYIYVDMCASGGDAYRIELIDSEDRAYVSHDDFGSGWNIGYPGSDSPENNGSFRKTLVFETQKDTIIKRLKVTPRASSDPFSIDWNGVPRISANGIAIEFYRGDRRAMFDEPGYSLPDPWTSDSRLYKWIFDIKLTNTNSATMAFSANDFTFKDGNNWVYRAVNDDREQKLLANESLRFPVTFVNVGEFSKPSKIIFENVSMDIGAWT